MLRLGIVAVKIATYIHPRTATWRRDTYIMRVLRIVYYSNNLRLFSY